MAGAATQTLERPSSSIDDSDVVLQSIRLGGKHYRANPPLHFAVEYDPADRVYRLSGDFGIVFTEIDRESLLKCLNDVLEMFWTDIAEEADDNMLTAPARALREEMRARLQELQEVNNHA